jgi:hypothetical protein
MWRMSTLAMALGFALVLLSATVGSQSMPAADGPIRTVSFREIHRDGPAAIIGHFRFPIGRTVRLEGTLAKPSHMFNASTPGRPISSA